MSPVPQSILRALSLPLDPSKSSLSSLGSGFSTTGRITARVPSGAGENSEGEDEERQFFVKTSPDGEEMFRGEYSSLNAIADSVPGFCPRALAWGPLVEDNKKGYFLVTEYLDLGGGSGSKKSTLARSLGKLHTTPAPPPPGGDKPMFGFPVATFCGDSRQPNNFRASWADFYANERLLMILGESERRNGSDKHLRDLVEQASSVVVPRLLGDGHLGYNKNGTGQGIVPVVVHGDLWSGNASKGRIVRNSSEKETEISDVVYDPCVCYAHNEYELGIMHMFGGFGRAFFDEYHKIVPKTEPVEEYDDRVKLYELYHHLNHHAIFGGGYKSGAVSIMTKLINKYGKA